MATMRGLMDHTALSSYITPVSIPDTAMHRLISGGFKTGVWGFEVLSNKININMGQLTVKPTNPEAGTR